MKYIYVFSYLNYSMTSKYKKKLLMCLRINSRDSLTNISKKTNIPVSTLFDNLKSLQVLISKYTILIDFFRLGYHCHAFVALKVPIESKNRLMGFLAISPCVNSLYRVNDGYDFLIESVHKTINDLDVFIGQLQLNYDLSHYKINYLLEELKKEDFIPDAGDDALSAERFVPS